MDSLYYRLLVAAREGKIDEIAALLDQGADIDAAPPPYQLTPLMRAVNDKGGQAALYLIDRGANISLQDVHGETALHKVCRVGSEVIARELLKRRAPVEAQALQGRRALHLAATQGRESIVRLLVTEHGAQVDATDEEGKTPFMAALEHGREGTASFLLSAGADCSVVDKLGLTALHHACCGGLASFVVKLLDEFGSDLHAKTKQGESCLHLAAWAGHFQVLQLLVDRGFSAVDDVNELGFTPLHFACERNRALGAYRDIAALLLDHGADIEHKDDRGWTPLSNTIIFGAPDAEELAILFIERGARLDGPVPEGFAFASLDKNLVSVHKNGFLKLLFTKPDTPIPPHRRTLCWALTSPAVAALVQKKGWSLLGTAKTEDEVEEMRKRRLGLAEDDAWKRRKHLMIDRALDWGYGGKGKVTVLKPTVLEEKIEKEGGRSSLISGPVWRAGLDEHEGSGVQ